jgi:hypothetical protein
MALSHGDVLSALQFVARAYGVKEESLFLAYLAFRFAQSGINP